MINNHERFLSDTANPKITIIIIKSFTPKENKEKQKQKIQKQE